MLGVDHDKIILLSTPFPTIPMLGKNCCYNVIVFFVVTKRCCIVLYCIVLYCIVLYCIVLYCIVLYCIVLYCIVLYCIVLYCIVLYFNIHCTIFYPPFCRPFRCWQSCHGYENCLLFSSLFVKSEFFFEKCPIQLFFIMIVDVGTILIQLKSTVIASIEYIY